MGNLMASLLNSANAMQVYEQALNVTENNVVNANTPGYAKQQMTFEANRFDLTTGSAGGVLAGPVQSSGDAYAEQAVRDQQTSANFYQQKVADLTPVESYFDTSSTSGIAPAMSQLFQDFSALSVNPNDTVARQTVLNDAATVSQQFNYAANGLLTQQSNLDQQTRSTVDSINKIASTIAGINAENRVDPSGTIDAGVDAQLNSSLEQLSQLVNFTALQQPDGSVTVYVGGQEPLVVGDQTYAIQGDFSSAQTAIDSSTGRDITGLLTGGQLGALLDDKNNVVPSYVANLNTLAQGFSDQVNTALDNGVDQNGAAPATDLFSYDAGKGAALTMGVNPLSPDQIAAALPGAPGGNGNALNLANLASAQAINGYTFAQFYGNIGGAVGNDVASATSSQSTEASLQPGAIDAAAGFRRIARCRGAKSHGIPARLPSHLQDDRRREQPDRYAHEYGGSGDAMISPLSPAAQYFLNGLDLIQKRMQSDQAQLTTGLKINSVSDAPEQMANLWQTRSNLDQVQRINSNLGQVQTEVNTGESVLETAVTLVERAQTLGTQGANSTTSVQTQQNLADELGSVLQQLVGVANTQVEGRYIFAGDSDHTAPYSIDLTQASPISAYQGSVSTRQIQAPDGSTFSVALTAQQIFDSPNAQDNVFVSINNLRQALLDGDSTGIASALGDVQSADTYLNQQLAGYGAIQDRVQSGLKFAQNYQTQLQTQLSGIEDADAAAAATEMTQSQTQLQAALESRAQMPNTSLFNFLG